MCKNECACQFVSCRFMQYVLKSCFDHLVETPTLTKSWKDVILNTLLYFANTWKLSEEAARQKKESEASLYKYKSHTHVIDSETDEADIINCMFPDYEAEFSKYDDNTEPMDCHDKTEEPSVAASTDSIIGPDVMVEVCMVYLLSSNVPTDHIPLLKCSQYRSSLLLGYLLAGSLTKQLTTLPGDYILFCHLNSPLLYNYKTCMNISVP